MKLITFKFESIAEILATLEEIFKSGDPINRRAEAIRLINQSVDVIYLPEWAEAKVIGAIVDVVIQGFNWIWGHEWLSHVQKLLDRKQTQEKES